MVRRLSKRQKAYREYLKSDHWKMLRTKAIEHYGAECNRCDSTSALQVHHNTYRTPWESCTVDDLEVVCRDCHRIEHGFAPNMWLRSIREIERNIMLEQQTPASTWITLKSWMLDDSATDIEDFAALMFNYVYLHLSTKMDGRMDWQKNRDRAEFWKSKALRVRNMILERTSKCRTVDEILNEELRAAA